MSGGSQASLLHLNRPPSLTHSQTSSQPSTAPPRTPYEILEQHEQGALYSSGGQAATISSKRLHDGETRNHASYASRVQQCLANTNVPDADAYPAPTHTSASCISPPAPSISSLPPTSLPADPPIASSSSGVRYLNMFSPPCTSSDYAVGHIAVSTEIRFANIVSTRNTEPTSQILARLILNKSWGFTKQPDEWEADAWRCTVPHCPKEFATSWLTRRICTGRHHCRRCGLTYCNTHSTSRVRLTTRADDKHPEVTGAERICDDCMTLINPSYIPTDPELERFASTSTLNLIRESTRDTAPPNTPTTEYAESLDYLSIPRKGSRTSRGIATHVQLASGSYSTLQPPRPTQGPVYYDESGLVPEYPLSSMVTDPAQRFQSSHHVPLYPGMSYAKLQKAEEARKAKRIKRIIKAQLESHAALSCDVNAYCRRLGVKPDGSPVSIMERAPPIPRNYAPLFA